MDDFRLGQIMNAGDLSIACGKPMTPRKEGKRCKYCGSPLSGYNSTGVCFSSGPCTARAREQRRAAKENDA